MYKKLFYGYPFKVSKDKRNYVKFVYRLLHTRDTIIFTCC